MPVTVRCENPNCGMMVPAPDNAPAFRCPICGQEQAITPGQEGEKSAPLLSNAVESDGAVSESPTPAPVDLPTLVPDRPGTSDSSNPDVLNCPICGRWIDTDDAICPVCSADLALPVLRSERAALRKELRLFLILALTAAPSGILFVLLSLIVERNWHNARLPISIAGQEGPLLYFLFAMLGAAVFWLGVSFAISARRDSGSLRLTMIA